AVDAEAAVADAVRVERADRAAANARFQRGEKNRVPSVERQLLNLFRFDRARHLRGGCLDECLSRGHRDGFLEGAELQLRVYRDLICGAQTNTRFDELLEARQFDADRVRPDGYVWEDIEPRRVRYGTSFVARCLVGEGDGRARKRSLLRVTDEARDLPRVELG